MFLRVKKVTCFKNKKENSSCKANGMVTLEDILDISYLLMENKDKKLWVSWPKETYQKDGQNVHVLKVIFHDENYKQYIEQEIMREYEKYVNIWAKMEAEKDTKPQEELNEEVEL